MTRSLSILMTAGLLRSESDGRSVEKQRAGGDDASVHGPLSGRPIAVSLPAIAISAIVHRITTYCASFGKRLQYRQTSSGSLEHL
jgi:hypothetical protein